MLISIIVSIAFVSFLLLLLWQRPCPKCKNHWKTGYGGMEETKKSGYVIRTDFLKCSSCGHRWAYRNETVSSS